MAAILMLNVPYAGHMNPTLPLARELVARGHHVSYVNALEWKDPIQETGAEWIPYRNYPENPTPQQKKTQCFRAVWDTALHLPRSYDLLLYEMFFYPGLRVAERLGIPCVRQFSQPAPHAQSARDRSRLFRLSCRLIDLQVMGGKNKTHMELGNQTLWKAVLQDKPDLNIVYVPRSFQPHADLFGADYLFVAPPPRPAPSGVKIPDSELTPPLVYLSLGSIISNRGFCRECIRAFGGKEFSVILNTGKIDPAALGKIPDNIHCYPFVPQIEVLSHADVFLTHCGMNSVNEAMALGVPMVAMPFLNDQPGNARRVVELGIGKKVRSFPSRGKELYQTVVDVWRDAEMKRRCADLRQTLRGEQSCEEACVEIERLLGR